ncbi:zinc-dependent alcohol dehydrogenase family protein [Sneathiella sp.]|jgi:NADPH:quinone reductase-like Zn-dependent oxidoreductase|uniref:zinc-dependent alcohol dehydrogenase family protein n=1 Tax=Sneathiella sp. TaxID=1964365 RepID=UPI0039E6D02E
MKAYVIGEGSGLEALTLVERDVPKPGPGEILVRMKANSINYRDLLTIKNAGARGITDQRIPNSDGAGIVEALGEGVTHYQAGDRVVGCFFQDWVSGPITEKTMMSALGGPIDGVLAEYVVLKEQGVLPIPESLSFEQAATLPCAAVTAWNCLIEKGEANAGDIALLLGTGGVSIFAQQIAKFCGIQTIVTSSSDEKLERVKKLGASTLINYRDQPDWENAVLEATNGKGVDVVIEVGGAGTLAKSVEAVRIGGTVSLVGVLTGGTIDPTSIMRKSVKLQGIYVGPQDMFAKLIRAIDYNELNPVIEETVAFDNAKDAYRLMESGQHFGKIVIAFS